MLCYIHNSYQFLANFNSLQDCPPLSLTCKSHQDLHPPYLAVLVSAAAVVPGRAGMPGIRPAPVVPVAGAVLARCARAWVAAEASTGC